MTEPRNRATAMPTRLKNAASSEMRLLTGLSSS